MDKFADKDSKDKDLKDINLKQILENILKCKNLQVKEKKENLNKIINMFVHVLFESVKLDVYPCELVEKVFRIKGPTDNKFKEEDYKSPSNTPIGQVIISFGLS